MTAEDFDQNSYHETDLKTQKQVEAGDDIYTLITDERWSLLIPLSDKQAARLADRTVMRVKFLKDGMTQSGDFSIMEIDGEKYGRLDFNKGLVRYASDRFLDIELVTNTVTGLKIPLSSVVTKEFYTIPSSFAATGSEGGEEGFFTVGKNKSGDNVKNFVTPTVYARVGQKQTASLGTEETEEKEIPLFKDVKKWLSIYFSGKEPDFAVPLLLTGSDFQKEVWEILSSIPYGKTMTYGEIAKQVAAKKGIPKQKG